DRPGAPLEVLARPVSRAPGGDSPYEWWVHPRWRRERHGCDHAGRRRARARSGRGTGGEPLMATPQGRGPTGTTAPGDGTLQGIDRAGEPAGREDLPPPKGDSDLRGQTPDDIEPPSDAL